MVKSRNVTFAKAHFDVLWFPCLWGAKRSPLAWIVYASMLILIYCVNVLVIVCIYICVCVCMVSWECWGGCLIVEFFDVADAALNLLVIVMVCQSRLNL